MTLTLKEILREIFRFLVNEGIAFDGSVKRKNFHFFVILAQVGYEVKL